jgi:hypothetical protein
MGTHSFWIVNWRLDRDRVLPTRFVSPMLMKKGGSFLNCSAGEHERASALWQHENEWYIVVQSFAAQDGVILVQISLLNQQRSAHSTWRAFIVNALLAAICRSFLSPSWVLSCWLGCLCRWSDVCILGCLRILEVTLWCGVGLTLIHCGSKFTLDGIYLWS